MTSDQKIKLDAALERASVLYERICKHGAEFETVDRLGDALISVMEVTRQLEPCKCEGCRYSELCGS